MGTTPTAGWFMESGLAIIQSDYNTFFFVLDTISLDFFFNYLFNFVYELKLSSSTTHLTLSHKHLRIQGDFPDDYGGGDEIYIKMQTITFVCKFLYGSSRGACYWPQNAAP